MIRFFIILRWLLNFLTSDRKAFALQDSCHFICLQLLNKSKKGFLFTWAYLLFLQWFFNSYLATLIPGVRGAWSNEGCKALETQKHKGFFICECNHLTNFALLMDVSYTRRNPFALSVVTWIGCLISILGLVITIIAHLYFK